ncbi:MAG: holo-ACP synthase [Clostridia bacterium]|jgi:holo-[acyl-carrier protein] synthase|nr:holo-ACP synthase [Clostridia bacterium]
MEIRTGVDIIEVARIQEAIEKQAEGFLKRVYTQKEIDYCSSTKKMKYQHYAARFAAKEAIFKAISSKILVEDTILNKIEIENQKDGKPVANLEKLKLENVESMDLSLSHLEEYAVASFTILFK